MKKQIEIAPEQELKKKVKIMIDKIEPFKNNIKLINAVTRFVLEDRIER